MVCGRVFHACIARGNKDLYIEVRELATYNVHCHRPQIGNNGNTVICVLFRIQAPGYVKNKINTANKVTKTESCYLIVNTLRHNLLDYCHVMSEGLQKSRPSNILLKVEL